MGPAFLKEFANSGRREVAGIARLVLGLRALATIRRSLASCAPGAETPTPILGRMSRNCSFCMICILTWQSRYQNPGTESTRLMNGRPTDARPSYANSLFSPALSVARNCAHFTRNTADKYLDCSFLCTELEIKRFSFPQNWGQALSPGGTV